MAYFDDLNHVARVACRAHKVGAEQVMTLHYAFHQHLLLSSGSLQALADRLRDDLIGPLRGCFGAEWTIDPIVVTDELDPLTPDHPREQVSAGPGGAGGRGVVANPLPLALSAVAHLRTAKIGRSFNGRIWLPGSKGEADINNGVWSIAGSYKNAYVALIDAIPLEPDIVTGDGSPVNLCVYSRTRRLRHQDQFAESVVSIDVDDSVHWLRSRDDGL